MGLLDRIFGNVEDPSRRLLAEGCSLYQKGLYEDALECLDLALQEDPGSGQAWNQRGLVCLALGKLDESRYSYDRALEIRPGFPEALVNKGSLLRQIAWKKREMGLLLEAMMLFDKALEVSPGFVPALHEKGLLVFSMGKKEEALTYFDRALKADPGYEYPWAWKGQVQFLQRDYENALECYVQALIKSPRNVTFIISKGLCLIQLGSLEQAETSFREALRHEPDHFRALMHLGEVLKRQKRYAEALDCFDRAACYVPNDPQLRKKRADTWFAMGNLALFQAGRYEDAEEYYAKTVELMPRHLQAWYCRGLALKKLGRYEESIPCYQKVIEIDRSFIDAWFDLATVMERLGRTEKAANCYLRVAQIDLSHIEAHYHAGMCLIELSRYRDAVACFNAVLRLDPGYTLAWYHRGEAMKHLDEPDEADFCFIRVSELMGRV